MISEQRPEHSEPTRIFVPENSVGLVAGFFFMLCFWTPSLRDLASVLAAFLPSALSKPKSSIASRPVAGLLARAKPDLESETGHGPCLGRAHGNRNPNQLFKSSRGHAKLRQPAPVQALFLERGGTSSSSALGVDARLPLQTSSQFAPPRPSPFLGRASAPPFPRVESGSGCRRRWRKPRKIFDNGLQEGSERAQGSVTREWIRLGAGYPGPFRGPGEGPKKALTFHLSLHTFHLSLHTNPIPPTPFHPLPHAPVLLSLLHVPSDSHPNSILAPS